MWGIFFVGICIFCLCFSVESLSSFPVSQTTNPNQMKNPKNLQDLANYTLKLLESIEEWNADILDEIADYAIELELAKLNADGMFERKKD